MKSDPKLKTEHDQEVDANIEPGKAQATQTATSADTQAADTLNPLPGEAGIPSVALRQQAIRNGRKLTAFATLTLTLLGASAFAYSHFTAAPAGKAEPQKRPSDKPAAASSDPRRLELPPLGNVAGPKGNASSPAAPDGATRSIANAAALTAAATPTALGHPLLGPGTGRDAQPVDPLGLYAVRPGTPAATAGPAIYAPAGYAPAGVPPMGSHRQLAPEDAPILLVSTRAAAAGANTPAASPAGTAPNGRPTAGFTSVGARESPAGPSIAGLDPNSPLAATTRNLEGYQQQLQGLLDTLTRSTALAGGAAAEAPASMTPAGGSLGGTPSHVSPGAAPSVLPPGGHPMGLPPQGFAPLLHPAGAHTGGTPTAASGLFGGQLPTSATPRVSATTLGNRSLMLAKGTAFTCALKTKVISATSGLVGCQVQRNVFSDDGRVLLIERGSHLDGEYRIANVRQGMVRIPVLWTRVRTPHGISVDLESPATGALGEAGIDGHVDNRWPERIGAAMLLSLIDDSVKLVIQNQANERSGDTIVLPSTTANTSRLAEKVLDSTINIPPLIYSNQGSVVGIYVARDIDFSGVYELRPSAVTR